MPSSQPNHAGIRVRHQKNCVSYSGKRCNCAPGYEAFVSLTRPRKKIRKTLPTLAAAKAWRAEAQVAVHRNELRPTPRTTLRDAAAAFLGGMADGSVRNRSGDAYKPSVIRSYETSLRLHVLPDLGGTQLSEIRRADIQALADRLLARGLDPSSVRNAVMPLRAVFRRAVVRGELTANPTHGLELPAVRGRRERIASPTEAAALLAVLPDSDRALWSTAMYAGLRLGELLALRWDDVDLKNEVIRVRRAFDPRAGFIEPKSQAGKRSVPIPGVLKAELAAHRLRQSDTTALAFGRAPNRPFSPSGVVQRAHRLWQDAGLEPLRPHEARHTYASLMIAAGVNAKALSTYMGHADIGITLNRYGHLMPGNEAEAADLLDAYLNRASAVRAP